MRSRWDEIIFAFESFAIKRVHELIELNDGVAELASFETDIEVVVADA